MHFVDTCDQGEATDTAQAYIATQGCLKVTVVAFWAMIWQENCKIIAMTTDLMEKGKVSTAVPALGTYPLRILPCYPVYVLE